MAYTVAEFRAEVDRQVASLAAQMHVVNERLVRIAAEYKQLQVNNAELRHLLTVQILRIQHTKEMVGGPFEGALEQYLAPEVAIWWKFNKPTTPPPAPTNPS